MVLAYGYEHNALTGGNLEKLAIKVDFKTQGNFYRVRYFTSAMNSYDHKDDFQLVFVRSPLNLLVKNEDEKLLGSSRFLSY